MAEDTAKADACKEYQSSLEDLTFNSKPHINNLTILAEENLKYSPEIVKLIEAQITKAPVSEKLPIMYLMDSIVKNVGGSYISLFAQNLMSTFASVFEKVDESTRKSLFKLRSTWDEMFQLTKLYALDVKVNKLDPAWPIKPLPPNVNSSSIHVNPKFLNRSLEEPATSSSTVAPVNSAKQNIAESQKNVTQEQEQFIRQQLLAKQKQLLELQQKKLELELEQTKAQLIASLASQHPIPDSVVTLGHSKLHVPITKVSPMLSTGTAKPSPAAVRPLQQESAQPEKSQAAHVSDTKVSNRDPRINRLSQQSTQTKDPVKKEGPLQTEKSDKTVSKKNSSAGGTSDRTENQTSISKQDKDKACDKSVRKESKISEGKSKLVSPVKNKLPAKNAKKMDNEKVKVETKRDPRLRKSSQDKTDSKVETKEKRASAEKKEEDQSKGTERKPAVIRNKAINGILLKNEKDGKEIEKDVSKSGGFNFRSHSRSSRSRSPISRSPVSRSARQRGSLSPKRRCISVSPLSKTQDKEKPVKRPDEYKQNTNNWEHRDLRKKANTKPEVRDTRKLKRTREDRGQESQIIRPENRNSPRRSPEPKENVENWHDPPSAKRWKSGWEEAKSLKQKQETQAHSKFPPHQQKDVHPGSKGILSPRTPRQQRMSVDANLQIPKELTSANKRDLLKKASQRLAAGEISYDEFLVVAHQINQLFQYQEEKSRSSNWQACHVTSRGFKTELKGESPSARTQVKGATLSEAEMSYLEHMSKLKRTRVQLEQSHEAELRWKTREARNKDISGDHSLSVREDGDQGSNSPNMSSNSYSVIEKHATKGTFQERKLGEKREANESGHGHYSEGRHSERRKLCDVKPVRRSPVGDNRQSHDKHCDGVSPLRQHKSSLVDEERNQSNMRDSKKHVDEKLPIKQIRSSPIPEDRYKTDSNHGKLCNNRTEPRNEHHKDQRQGSKHQPVLERDLQEFSPRDGQDIKREEPRSQCDHNSEEKPAYDAPQRGNELVEISRPRSGVLEMPQRFRELTDRPGQGKTGSTRNLEKLRTDEPIEPDRTWLRSRDGSPSCDGHIVGSRMRLQDPPEQVVHQIDGALELPGLWIEGIPGQPSTHFDGSHSGQSGACFDGPVTLHAGQPGVRFDSSGGPRSGQPCLRFDSPHPRQPGPRFDGPRLGQPGPRFDGPRPGQPGPRFDGSHLGQPGMRFNGPHPGQPGTRFDSPGGHPGQPGVHFEGPQPGTRIDGSHPGQPCGHFDSLGGHPGQPSTRFGPHTGQPGTQLDNSGSHLGNPRFDVPHPGQPAMHFDGPHSRQSGARFDSPDGLLGQARMRFDGPHPGQPSMRFDGPNSRLGQPIARFDGPHPGQPSTHFDDPGGRPAQCAVRFDGPQLGQPGTHYDGSGSHPGQSAIRFDGPAGTRFDIIATQPGAYFDNSRGPQFDGAPVHPDPRCSVAGHLFNGHPPSSQYQGRVFDGQSGPRFNMPQGSHYNESAVHGATALANPTYGPAGPCFDGQAPLPRLAGPHNDPACGTFYNSNLPASLPENMRQLQPVNAMTGFPHNQIPFSQGQQYIPSQSSVPVAQIQQGSSFAPLDNHLGQLDVNALFAKLLSTGILKSNPVESIPTQSEALPEGDPQAQTVIEEDEEEENEENIPDLTSFQIEELKQRYDGVISRLYTGIQCYSCGMRFTASQTDVYADHLDWHYRMNRMEKDITKKVTYRKWYYSLTDWIEFEEIADLEERAKSQFFEKVHEEVVQRTQEAAKEKEFQSVPAGPAGVHEVCEICQEPFEQYWDEDEEEWHLKNAVRMDSRTYHPACYEDYKNASFTDTTPSPSEAPIENPLHLVIKQERLDGSCKSSDLTNSYKDTENDSSCVLTDTKTEKDTATVKMETL